MGNSGLDHPPPNHWARGRARRKTTSSQERILALAGATYTYTMYSVQNKDDVDIAIEAREGKDKGNLGEVARDATRGGRVDAGARAEISPPHARDDAGLVCVKCSLGAEEEKQSPRDA